MHRGREKQRCVHTEEDKHVRGREEGRQKDAHTQTQTGAHGHKEKQGGVYAEE